jgi:hypothetical protein
VVDLALDDEDRVVGVVGDDPFQVFGAERLGVVGEDVLCAPGGHGAPSTM